MMPVIQLHGVSFAYNRRSVLEGISLDVARGERVALLGPNGAGKTTLLKLISGALVPSTGSVLVDGSAPRAVSSGELARKIAVVPQEFTVPFSFSVREIVDLGRTPYLRLLGGLRAADRRAVNTAMEVTDTLHLAGRIFNELSGGERRRVMIAMALAQGPEVLLLDEPTQQLDVCRQADVLDLITELNSSQGITVVAAIHDLNLASRYFERLIFLHHASLLADGAPQEVLRADFLEQIYDGPIEVVPSNHGGIPIVLPIPRSLSSERKT